MKRFKHILCVVGAEQPCQALLEKAVALAETNQADLTAVSVAGRIPAGIGMADGGPTAIELQDALLAEHAQALETALVPYRQRLAIQSRVLVGKPFLEVIREVLRAVHDLVLKAPEDPDWLDLQFGSDDMHLLRKCHCPVWLIKCPAPPSYRRILAAVDLDDNYPMDGQATRHALNRQILQLAASLALGEFAELHVVAVWEAIGEGMMRTAFGTAPQEKVVAYVEQVRHQHAASLDACMREVEDGMGAKALEYLKPQTHLVRGWASKEIPALVRRLDADLVVMGTVGRSGIPGLIMGNTAETILHQIDCAVLAIKPPGFVTPVSLDN